MAKEDLIEVQGVVLEALPDARFKVEIDGTGHLVTAHLAGKLKMHNIKILPGDHVRLELTPYDLSMGRITWRGK